MSDRSPDLAAPTAEQEAAERKWKAVREWLFRWRDDIPPSAARELRQLLGPALRGVSRAPAEEEK